MDEWHELLKNADEQRAQESPNHCHVVNDFPLARGVRTSLMLSFCVALLGLWTRFYLLASVGCFITAITLAYCGIKQF